MTTNIQVLCLNCQARMKGSVGRLMKVNNCPKCEWGQLVLGQDVAGYLKGTPLSVWKAQSVWKVQYEELPDVQKMLIQAAPVTPPVEMQTQPDVREMPPPSVSHLAEQLATVQREQLAAVQREQLADQARRRTWHIVLVALLSVLLILLFPPIGILAFAILMGLVLVEWAKAKNMSIREQRIVFLGSALFCWPLMLLAVLVSKGSMTKPHKVPPFGYISCAKCGSNHAVISKRYWYCNSIKSAGSAEEAQAGSENPQGQG